MLRKRTKEEQKSFEMNREPIKQVLETFDCFPLTERQKQVMEMYFLQEMSSREIARELNISESAVRDYIDRVIKKARTIIRHYEVYGKDPCKKTS
jgi:RNA polymerase sigma factor (sigma-70 family)